MPRFPALIVGGGPAGAAAAIALARQGVRPLLIERDRETRDALCGGFLSWATLDRLRAFGIDTAALGARRIDRLALFAGTRSAEARLPAPAAGLTRRTLDTALLARAAEAGVAIERGVAARRWESGHILVEGREIAADAILLATGKHELRGVGRPKGDTIGLRFRLAASPALDRLLAGRIELHLFRGGYAGLLLQEDGAANLCLAARGWRLDEAGGRPERLLDEIAAESHGLAERLGAAATIGAAQAIANIPYGWRASGGSGGLYRLGDQAGVIPSLAGEGIAIALASGGAAADAIVAGLSPGAFQSRLGRRLARPFAIAGVLRHCAEYPAGARLLLAVTGAAPALADLAARLTRLSPARLPLVATRARG
jgi:flavin-dependent dehydrogenase